MKKLLIVTILIALAAISAPSAAAAEVGSGANKFILTDSTTTTEKVDGDYVALARSIRLSGDVDGDVIVGGGEVMIRNASARNIFAGGQNVLIAVGTAKNIYAAGTYLEVSSSGGITGAYLAGQTVVFSGIAADLAAAGGSIRIDGIIRENAVLRSDDITFGKDAAIGGTLTIYAASMPPLPGSIDRSNVIFHEVHNSSRNDLQGALRALSGVTKFVGVLSAILLAVLVTLYKGGVIRESALAFPKKAGWAILFGLIAFIAVPVGALIAMMTLVGTSAAVIVLMAYGVFLSLSPVIAGAVLGRLIFPTMHRCLSAVIGAAVLKLATFVPFLGAIVWLACAFYVLGLVVMSFKPYREETGGTPPAKTSV
jgi:hypothetical protein